MDYNIQICRFFVVARRSQWETTYIGTDLIRMVHSPLQSFVDFVNSTLSRDNAIWPQVLVSVVAIVVVGVIFKHIFTGRENESPVPINVPIPEQVKAGWRGEVLDDPNIKVG